MNYNMDEIFNSIASNPGYTTAQSQGLINSERIRMARARRERAFELQKQKLVNAGGLATQGLANKGRLSAQQLSNQGSLATQRQSDIGAMARARLNAANTNHYAMKIDPFGVVHSINEVTGDVRTYNNSGNSDGTHATPSWRDILRKINKGSNSGTSSPGASSPGASNLGASFNANDLSNSILSRGTPLASYPRGGTPAFGPHRSYLNPVKKPGVNASYPSSGMSELLKTIFERNASKSSNNYWKNPGQKNNTNPINPTYFYFNGND